MVPVGEKDRMHQNGSYKVSNRVKFCTPSIDRFDAIPETCFGTGTALNDFAEKDSRDTSFSFFQHLDTCVQGDVTSGQVRLDTLGRHEIQQFERLFPLARTTWK